MDKYGKKMSASKGAYGAKSGKGGGRSNVPAHSPVATNAEKYGNNAPPKYDNPKC